MIFTMLVVVPFGMMGELSPVEHIMMQEVDICGDYLPGCQEGSACELDGPTSKMTNLHLSTSSITQWLCKVLLACLKHKRLEKIVRRIRPGVGGIVVPVLSLQDILDFANHEVTKIYRRRGA